MKQKILFLLLTISILLSLIGGTTGCSLQQVSTSAKVNPNSPTTIGDAKKSGVELLIPEGTFEKKVKVSINKWTKTL